MHSVHAGCNLRCGRDSSVASPQSSGSPQFAREGQDHCESMNVIVQFAMCGHSGGAEQRIKSTEEECAQRKDHESVQRLHHVIAQRTDPESAQKTHHMIAQRMRHVIESGLCLPQESANRAARLLRCVPRSVRFLEDA